MIYGDIRSSFSPKGREYVTRWNPLVDALTGNPVNTSQGLPQTDAPKKGEFGSGMSSGSESGGRDDYSPENRAQYESVEGERVPGQTTGAIPAIGGFDLTPTKAGLASFGGNIAGNAIAGLPGGAAGGFLAGQAAGQPVGKGIGQAAGGLLGAALFGPLGGVAGSWLGGMAGNSFDPNYGGFQTVNNPAAVANAQQAALSNIESTEGGGGGGYDGGGYGSPTSDGNMPSDGNFFNKGGHVTRDRLIGPDPHGPDDGYAALDAGEFVIKASDVKKLGGPDKTRKRLAELLANK